MQLLENTDMFWHLSAGFPCFQLESAEESDVKRDGLHVWEGNQHGRHKHTPFWLKFQSHLTDSFGRRCDRHGRTNELRGHVSKLTHEILFG